MPSYIIKSRTAGPIVEETVEATSRDAAIAQVVHGDIGATGATGPQEGPEVEVLSAEEVSPDGPTGPAGQQQQLSAPASQGAVKHTRAELNEMTKEELLDVAEAEGVDVNAHWNKADIVDAIVKHK